MARTTYVKSARPSKRPRRCTKCGADINVGDSYKWFATRIGRMSIRKNFCSNCQIRQSDRTTSGNLQTLYLALENAEDALGALGTAGSLEEYSAIVREAAEGVREAAQMYSDSADNMEDGFGHETYLSEEIREKAEELESFADEIESAADDIESLDDPDEDAEEFLSDFDGDTDEEGEPTDQEEWETYVEEKREERRQAALDAAEEALSNCPM